MEKLLPISSVMFITPEIAKKYIGDSIGRKQRSPIRSVVKEYAEIMRKGEWVLNYQPIQIGEDGNVLDGQHRLLACIESNSPFQTLVIDNVPESAFDTMDRGRARTLGDVLSSRNILNHNTLASAIGYLWVIQNNNYWLVQTGSSKGVATTGGNRHFRVTPQQADDFLKKNPLFADFVAHGIKVRNAGSKFMSPSSFVALWYVCSKQDGVKAEIFFSQLSTGANIKEDDPVFYIRTKLLDKVRGNVKMPATTIVNLILKGFDMYCEGRKVNSFIPLPASKETYRLKTQMDMF